MITCLFEAKYCEFEGRVILFAHNHDSWTLETPPVNQQVPDDRIAYVKLYTNTGQNAPDFVITHDVFPASSERCVICIAYKGQACGEVHDLPNPVLKNHQ